MSTSKQYNNSKTTTTSKFSKNLSPTEVESKFELIDANEHSELIGKLSDQVGHFSRELNNNSISPGSTVEGSSGLFSAFRMDPKRKSPSEAKQPITTSSSSAATEKNGDAKVSLQQEEPVLQIPSYSSIFTPSLYSKSASPSQQQQQNSYRQLPLKSDQTSYRDQDENQVSTNGRFSGRKLAGSKGDGNKSKHESFEAEDDLDEEEIDEKMPFNNKKYRSSGKRGSPGGSQRCQSPSAGKQPIFAFNNHSRCESDHQQNPHTKISIHDGRLPSLGVCNQTGYSQQNESYNNRKIYLSEQPLCYRCDCNDCHRKLKSTSGILDGASNPSPESYSKSHSRTKSIHLVLKSIILVLLTLLLLMLFVGIILASHYLPQVFDRVLNASRSFNVTIAG